MSMPHEPRRGRSAGDPVRRRLAHHPSRRHGWRPPPYWSVTSRSPTAASIFYGAVVRADLAAVTIGEATNLQDNVVVHTAFGHPAVIGPGVSIGHSAVVHGCTIEADCLIGIHATVLNGAVIGEGSLVAAGAVVLEGAQIPPHSLVTGIPGRVRRELSPDECDKIKENARIYLRLAAGQGTPLGRRADPA